MAFTSAITGRNVVGNNRAHEGTFTNTGGSAGGDINTGLTKCSFIALQHTGSAVVASAPVVYETLPIAGSAITIVTTADADGYWRAWGF